MTLNKLYKASTNIRILVSNRITVMMSSILHAPSKYLKVMHEDTMGGKSYGSEPLGLPTTAHHSNDVQRDQFYLSSQVITRKTNLN